MEASVDVDSPTMLEVEHIRAAARARAETKPSRFRS